MGTHPDQFSRSQQIPTPVVGLLLLCVFLSGCYSSTANNGPSDIRLVEALRIGEETNEDGVVFGRISGLVAVNSQGSIFVGDQQASQIHAFTPEGELIESLGNKGRGPAEFRFLEDIRTGPGDTLYAFDSGSRRISAFDPASLDLAYDFTVAEDADERRPSDLIGAIEAGFVVTYNDLPLPGTNFASERYTYARLVSHGGNAVDNAIARVPSRAVLLAMDGMRIALAGMPFGPAPVFRVGPDGHIYSGSTESIAIAVTAISGAERGLIQHSLQLIPIADNELEERLDRLPEEMAKLVRDSDLPDIKPAYSTFVADDHGRVWVRLTLTEPDSRVARWLVLDSRSRLAGEVELPSSANLMVIAVGRAYAVDESDTGLSVVVYEIAE